MPTKEKSVESTLQTCAETSRKVIGPAQPRANPSVWKDSILHRPLSDFLMLIEAAHLLRVHLLCLDVRENGHSNSQWVRWRYFCDTDHLFSLVCTLEITWFYSRGIWFCRQDSSFQLSPVVTKPKNTSCINTLIHQMCWHLMVTPKTRQQGWALFLGVCTFLLFILQGFSRISCSQKSFLEFSCHLGVFSRNPKSLSTEKLHDCLLLIRVTGFQSTRPTDLVVE